MENEKIAYRITSKGEVYGMSMLLPLYMQIALFVEKEENPTLLGLIKDLDRVFERGHRRSIQNEDGTLSAEDAVEVGETFRLYEYQKARIEKNASKL